MCVLHNIFVYMYSLYFYILITCSIYHLLTPLLHLLYSYRQYHPLGPSSQRQRSIPMQFKTRLDERDDERKRSGNDDSDATNGDGYHSTNISRFDGGMGGRASDGMWQIELAHVAVDPRDPSRSTGTAMSAAELAASTSNEPVEEEFPALPSEGTLPSRALWAHSSTSSVKSKVTKRASNADFPTLPQSSSTKSLKDMKKAAFAPLVPKSSASSIVDGTRQRGGVGVGVGGGIANSMSAPSLSDLDRPPPPPSAEDFPSMPSSNSKVGGYRGSVVDDSSLSMAARLHM